VQTTGVEVVSDSEHCIIDLCESRAKSTIPEVFITLNKIFLPVSCEFVPVEVEDIILNLSKARGFVEIHEHA